ncbi:hypothetical protein FHX51_000389 [Aeriscardovia aeriphila]|nr:hypothetical protein [Aeriscardovia aeriphila]
MPRETADSPALAFTFYSALGKRYQSSTTNAH